MYHIAMIALVRRLPAALTLALALSILPACTADTDDDVCDASEATSYGDDCGYWADDGSGTAIFLWYVWVTPYQGGTPPSGLKPVPPAGAKTVKPPAVKPPLPPGVKAPAAKPVAPPKGNPPPPARPGGRGR